MVTTFTNSMIRWRWLVILLTLIWVGFSASGMRYLGFTTDYRAFFSSDNPQMLDFEKLQNTYDKSDNILFIISPKDGEVFTANTLESIQWLTEQAWQTPYSKRVDSITNFQHTRANGDELVVEALVRNPHELSDSELQQLRITSLNQASLYKRLINDETSITGVNVTVHLPKKSSAEVPEVAGFALQLAERLREKDSNLQVRLAGIVMFNHAFGDNAKNDMTKLVPLMFLTIIVGIGLLMRSFSATFTTTVIIFMSIMVGMGAFGWFGFKLSPPSASAPNIILTMAVADSVHLLMTFLYVLRSDVTQKITKFEAITESMRINFQPVLITTLTTVLGFLALNFSEVPPLVHLGNIVAVGVTAAFVLTITLLPAMLAVLPINIKRNFRAEQKDIKNNIVLLFSNWVIHKRSYLLWITVGITLLFISQIPSNELDDDFVKYFDTSTHIRQDTDYAIKHLIGPNRIEYSLDSGKDGGINNPNFIGKVKKFVDYLELQPEVAHVTSIVDTLKRLNKSLHGDDPNWYRIPEQQSQAAQYLLLYEMSLPYGLDLNNLLNVKKSATRVVVSFEAVTSKQMLELEQRFGTWLKRHTPEVSFSAASTNLMFSHIGQRNTRSMLGGAVIALVLISFILVLTFRSLKIGVTSLIPNLIPVAMAFGAWGLLVGKVGLSLAPVVGMTLGIVVDDTVHFLSKYLRARRDKKMNSQDAIRYAFDVVGPAMLVTTAVLVTGFLVLSLSVFKLNADMGALTAGTIGLALLIDFLLLPPLLMKFDEEKS
ncbi:MAG: MMPL family transporter [Kangiellaceae bacterium]|nr:MMPL family transporter [Kangiellaceae bacterium]